ncbi:hypothetical protein OE88DRAFT_1657912 [Heliocybe sulcata]|uniref:Zinc knuckle-domain-containing protein n=1 Tax=Heliocybe sulcata TaxID=5364 RepID=A0A5C3N4J9_9AGAM|nr:hypothetical protein OE88DRAFT_1657912 [Heliocybe sulcata]
MSKFAPHRKSYSNPTATSSTICQKCLGTGHFTYQCKATARPYLSRPSRTQQLENPRSLAKLKEAGRPSVDVPEELKSKTGTANRILEAKEKERAEKKKSSDGPSRKRARRGSSSDSSSGSDSSSQSDSSESDSNSDTESSSSDSDSESSGSRSQERDRRRRVPHDRRRSFSSSPGERGRS